MKIATLLLWTLVVAVAVASPADVPSAEPPASVPRVPQPWPLPIYGAGPPAHPLASDANSNAASDPNDAPTPMPAPAPDATADASAPAVPPVTENDAEDEAPAADTDSGVEVEVGEPVVVVDVQLNDGEDESGQPTANVIEVPPLEAEAPAMPSVSADDLLSSSSPMPMPSPPPLSRLSSLFSSLFGFGRNPSARELHRRPAHTTTVVEFTPEGMQVTSESRVSTEDDTEEDGEADGQEAGVPVLVAAPAPARGRGGWFSSIVDALFGPSPIPDPAMDIPMPMPMPMPAPEPVRTRWFGWRPPFFRSLLGRPGPSASEGGEAQAPAPLMAGSEEEGAAPGMVRAAGSGGRLSKVWNRIMRFLRLRPHPSAPEDSLNMPGSDETENDASDSSMPRSEEEAEEDSDSEREDEASNSGGEEEESPRRRRHHQRRACRADMIKFCTRAKLTGGFMGAVQCMLARRNELSAECLAHIQYSRAFNCAGDALKLCPSARTRHQLKRCMKLNRAQVSLQCAQALDAHHRLKHSPDASTTTPTPASEPTPSAPATPEPIAPPPVPAPASSTPAPTRNMVEMEVSSTSRVTSPAHAPVTTSTRVQAMRALPRWAQALLGVAGVLLVAALVWALVAVCRRRQVNAANAKAPLLTPAARSPSASRVQITSLAPPAQPAMSVSVIAV